MANYALPTFNLIVRIWRAANWPADPPNVETVGNLGPGKRLGILLSETSTGGDVIGGMWLLLPAGTDVQDTKNGSAADVVEVPAGSGRVYHAVWVDDIGVGFANEHRFAELVGFSPWPTPFPGGGFALGSFLLIEGGSRLLLEDGFDILLE